jgi:beta-fructofuranosidase
VLPAPGSTSAATPCADVGPVGREEQVAVLVVYIVGMDDSATATRRRLAHDPHRPRYHFLPPSNWMNDPNGLIHWRGRYHLFYQHNPEAAAFGTMHWGHAMSDDLVHWRDLPLALSPTPGSADESGVWSGCAVDDDGTASVLYTGVRRAPDGTLAQVPFLATSTDNELRMWDKYPGNPVIAAPPPGLDVLGFRDHSVWKDGSTWCQAIGSGIRNVGGAIFVYRSPDLRNWEYVGPLCVGDGQETGEMWECPDFFPLGDRHVLMVSPIPLRKTLYFTGDYREYRFTPRYRDVVDDGGYFYAPQSFTDASGRRIMFGWLWEGRDEAAQRAAGWAGVMSLPRLLEPLGEGRVGMQPVPELRVLRGKELRPRAMPLTSARRLDVSGAALEIVADIDPGSATQVGISVRCAADGSEQTVIVYDTASHTLAIDRQRSSLDPAAERDTRSARLELAQHELLQLHIFVDHSVVEVFANGRQCMASRVYPTRADSLGVEVFAAGGAAHALRVAAWEMASVRPTTSRPTMTADVTQ